MVLSNLVSFVVSYADISITIGTCAINNIGGIIQIQALNIHAHISIFGCGTCAFNVVGSILQFGFNFLTAYESIVHIVGVYVIDAVDSAINLVLSLGILVLWSCLSLAPVLLIELYS